MSTAFLTVLKREYIFEPYPTEGLDKKKLQRVKDVEYSKEIGEIKSIPALQYMKQTKHFTLKNVDKRVSTLKSLPPKKGSIKNTKLNVDIDEVTTDEVAEEI